MSSSNIVADVGVVERSSSFDDIFRTLTTKQHEVFALVAENRTSKEIGGRLGVSESAINQRIEAVRTRAGFPPRAELARAYRSYTMRHAANSAAMVREAEDHVSAASHAHGPGVGSSAGLSFGDPRLQAGQVVPGAFLRPNAGLNRVTAMVAIAGGLLTVALVGLSVTQAIATLL